MIYCKFLCRNIQAGTTLRYPELGDELAAEQELVQAACLRWLGEAEAEALYEASDAHVLGVRLSDATRHAIFLEHLGKGVKTIH